jgi:hypothetical protein
MRFVGSIGRFFGTIGKYLPLLLLAAIPFVGQIVLTILILQESRSRSSAFLWIAAVWAVPYIGPLAYIAAGNQGLSRAQYGTILLVLGLIALLGTVLVVLGLAVR